MILWYILAIIIGAFKGIHDGTNWNQKRGFIMKVEQVKEQAKVFELLGADYENAFILAIAFLEN